MAIRSCRSIKRNWLNRGKCYLRIITLRAVLSSIPVVFYRLQSILINLKNFHPITLWNIRDIFYIYFATLKSDKQCSEKLHLSGYSRETEPTEGVILSIDTFTQIPRIMLDQMSVHTHPLQPWAWSRQIDIKLFSTENKCFA